MKFENVIVGNYKLVEKYHVPTILYKEENDDEPMEFTYGALEEALADLLYFAWEDKMFHNTAEVRQCKTNDRPNMYKKILDDKFHLGFMKLNANVIVGMK